MWEDRYGASEAYLFGTEPAQMLVENPWLTADVGGGTVLCVADGEGRNGVYLAGCGLQVCSFEQSPTAVARARALAEARGVALEAHEIAWADWDWDRQFDMVVGIFIQYATPAERPAQFADLSRALRPGGRLVLHGYTPEQVGLGTGGPPCADHMYTEDMLRDAFDGWQIERLAAYERDVQEGRGHAGHSALIDVVARKV
ncbi:SAM-dependent methyltransferase [Pararhodobacter oceanensis]|uniref:SAM-dependent methyltransferase n=1 Tax=Pararhodobacter oceanensis TaxID=2172121 RepID=A0A2T8HYF5_9RHOB|nr:class I SAM-dependent methyltransferase [Pararhodobacter oceanensis]PVH30463.1 SAM-dependent methyltransferase [Pararhodobacter oceanensis]